MPEMDGITASCIIKQELRERSPYIIACTADLQYDTRSACEKAGIDDYLEKVFCLVLWKGTWLINLFQSLSSSRIWMEYYAPCQVALNNTRGSDRGEILNLLRK